MGRGGQLITPSPHIYSLILSNLAPKIFIDTDFPSKIPKKKNQNYSLSCLTTFMIGPLELKTLNGCGCQISILLSRTILKKIYLLTLLLSLHHSLRLMVTCSYFLEQIIDLIEQTTVFCTMAAHLTPSNPNTTIPHTPPKTIM